jgi:two-component system CitB family sensor kinase
MPRPRFPFTRQVLALQVAVVTLVVGVGFVLFGWMVDRELINQYGQRSLGVAHSVATDPIVIAAATRRDEATGRYDPDGVVQQRAEAVRVATGALFVVVTDRNGLRMSHRDPSKIGERVSTSPDETLSGKEVVRRELGTLGWSVRAKVPLYDGSAKVVGIVSVGFSDAEIGAYRMRLLTLAAPFAASALLLGVAGSWLLTRRLKRQTLGLEPHELAELVQEREAVLHGAGEGVFAVDAQGRVSVCNGEAARLLGVAPVLGTPMSELDLPAGIRSALSEDRDADNLITIAGSRVLIANSRGVRRGRRDLGRVLTLRDRSDLEALTNELDAVRALTEGLRAQRHEFSNRLHTIAGLLQIGHHAEAVEYLHTLSAPTLADTSTAAEQIRDPCLRAFLGAKTAIATEKGVCLNLGEESWVPDRVTAPIEVTTVLSNLVDNAIEAARLGSRRPATVDVVLACEEDRLHVYVADSGDGVPDPLRKRIFVQGVSTRDGDGRGLGLALAQQAAHSLGGEILLADPGGSGSGAVFTSRLPGVLSPVVEVPL